MSGATSAAAANAHWWPNQLDLRALTQNPHSPTVNPFGESFDYVEAVKKINVAQLKKVKK